MTSWGMFVVRVVAEKQGPLRELLYKKSTREKGLLLLGGTTLARLNHFLILQICLKKTSITRGFMGGKLHFYILENQKKNHVYRFQDALCLYLPLSLPLALS